MNRRNIAQFLAAAAASGGSATTAFAAEQASAGLPPDRQGRLDPRAIRHFSARIHGQVIIPGAADYDLARLVFNRAFDKHPAMIVRCTDASEIARSLEFAQRQQLPLAVRGGGHNRAGLSVCDGGVVIDLSAMNQVRVDAGTRTAYAQAGALTVHVDAFAQPLGLATTLAGCPAVGIAGLTLGGGEGILMSTYGAACDNLLSAELVMADGRMVTASEADDPDLFWAIRGGGGNFGVAASLNFRMHEIADVLAGKLEFLNRPLPEMLGALSSFVAAAPDEMNVIAQLLPSPGGMLFRMLFCHCGDPRRGNELLAALRSLGPSVDDFRVLSYLQANATLNPATAGAHFQTNLFVPGLSEAVVAELSDAMASAPPGTRVFIVPFYGRITRVRPADTAFPLRSAGYELDIMGRWNEPGTGSAAVQWVTTLRDRLRSFASGAYVNQLGETSEELVRVAYGQNYQRLRLLKKKYDPANILRSNQNIAPA